MRIRFLTLSAGPEGVFYPGTCAEVSPDEGRILCSGRFAVAVDEGAPPGEGSPCAEPVELFVDEGAPQGEGSPDAEKAERFAAILLSASDGKSTKQNKKER